MTLEHDLATSDLFGLEGTFPRPGWVVLDAARDRRFTGEIVFDTVPQVRVYLDRGDIYLAERVTDPSIGARLVDAGALNDAQLEHGTLRVGGEEHLGRLFERVPSVDRHAVLITAEMMTDECVGWLAHQRVDAVESTPYRHHPSGVHRWDDALRWSDLAPGDPLPAPGPHETPVEMPIELTSPEPLFAPEGVFTDDMIKWDEPSWLDERLPVTPSDPAGRTSPEPPPVEPTPGSAAVPPESATTAPATPEPSVTEPATSAAVPEATGADDWIERLETDGLPEVGADPLASTKQLPTRPVEPADRFEVIWPSGEIDEDFGATDAAEVGDHHPDLDRAGPTARVARAPEPVEPSIAEAPTTSHVESIAPGDPGEGDDEALTDEVVLAVRRAVASIETGSLATRRRLADTPPDGSLPQPELPARVAARTEYNDWAPGVTATGVTPPARRSVFDDVPIDLPGVSADVNEADVNEAAQVVGEPEPVVDTPERTSALRRLIGSLRRR